MLDENEKDEILGAEVSIILKGGTRMHGELLYARDSTVIICEKYSATDKELIEQIYPPKIIQNKEIQELTIEGSSYVWLGFIGGGITGGLLSSCLSYGISCTAILVPAPTGFPDPEGAALLIDSFNKITNNDKLKIDATELKEQGKNIRQQLEKIMQSVAEQKQQASAEDKLMYG